MKTPKGLRERYADDLKAIPHEEAAWYVRVGPVRLEYRKVPEDDPSGEWGQTLVTASNRIGGHENTLDQAIGMCETAAARMLNWGAEKLDDYGPFRLLKMAESVFETMAEDPFRVEVGELKALREEFGRRSPHPRSEYAFLEDHLRSFEGTLASTQEDIPRDGGNGIRERLKLEAANILRIAENTDFSGEEDG